MHVTLLDALIQVCESHWATVPHIYKVLEAQGYCKVEPALNCLGSGSDLKFMWEQHEHLAPRDLLRFIWANTGPRTASSKTRSDDL